MHKKGNSICTNNNKVGGDIMQEKTSVFSNISDELDITIFLLFYEELESLFGRMLIGEPKNDFKILSLD